MTPPPHSFGLNTSRSTPSQATQHLIRCSQTTQLEERACPAVVSFSTTMGTLTVDARIDGVTKIAVGAHDSTGKVFVKINDREVAINGASRGVQANTVRRIQVFGSTRSANNIDLSDVKAPQFNNLNGRVVIYGGGAADKIIGSAFNDVVWAGNGNDTIYGGKGNDILFGEGGNDTFYGEDGNDQMYGGAGRDIFFGGAGNDWSVDWSSADAAVGRDTETKGRPVW